LQDGEDIFTPSYLKRVVSSTDPLQTQGDGMRSFATVILKMLAPDTPSLLLLDEPEAFLHPPQARLLGEFIAKERPTRSQLFAATHSPEVLQGMLGAAPESQEYNGTG
jgi:predicted ATPase